MDAVMNDDVTISHSHADGEQPMDHVSDERVDGLRLQEYTCSCGFSAAILTRVTEERQGQSWPFQFRSPPLS
jgi:hypothetical protein